MEDSKKAGGETQTKIRRLVACPACSLQYDVSKIPPGNRFRCTCGGLVSVVAAGVREAAVVRCSSCGAPRRDKSDNCRFCGSGFTLHERDLNTLCPQCLARISDRARFCHGCGVAITPHSINGEATDQPCPACRGERRLSSRRLDEDVSVLECANCGGLWLGHEVFGLLQRRAMARQIRWLGQEGDEDKSSGHFRPGPLYRSCPVCDRQMSRRNFERRSGVVVDVCNSHGIWLDMGELDSLLRWIQDGGLARAAQRERLREQESAQRNLFRRPADPLEQAGVQEFGRSSPRSGGLVGQLVKFLIDSA